MSNANSNLDRQAEIKKIFEEAKAIITGSHVVYTSGKHGDAYVNKDAVYPHTDKVSKLCSFIAEDFEDYEIDAVVGPVIGGVSLSQWTAHHLSRLQGKEVLAISADKIEKPSGATILQSLREIFTEEEIAPLVEKLKDVPAEVSFTIKRGQDKLIAGKKVLGVEDVLTTGGSVKKVVEALKQLDCEIVGVGALCNRGNITPEQIGDVPVLKALVNVTLDAFDEADCPYCKNNVPINTSVGKGADFLKKKSK